MTSAATFLPAKFSREISGDFHTSRNFGADAAAGAPMPMTVRIRATYRPRILVLLGPTRVLVRLATRPFFAIWRARRPRSGAPRPARSPDRRRRAPGPPESDRVLRQDGIRCPLGGRRRAVP